jgi:hypothetical protein
MVELLKKLAERAESAPSTEITLDRYGVLVRMRGRARGLTWREIEYARPEIYDGMVDRLFAYLEKANAQ